MQVRRHILTMAVLLLTVLTSAAAGTLSTDDSGDHHPDAAQHPDCPSARHPRQAQRMARRAAELRQAGLYHGERRQLVVLVSFSDMPFHDEAPLTLWNRIFNEPDFTEPPFYGSVRDYFLDQSYGQLSLNFDLYHVAVSKSYTDFGGADDAKVGLLLTEVVDSIAPAVADWSVYDWDADGYIDQVLMLYAGKGQNNGGGPNTIWPHQWWLSDPDRSPYPTEPYPVTSGGQTWLIDNYGCFAELTSKGDYGTFGTLCHEYGHCLGLPDFYYGRSTTVVRSWDIMDYGNNNMGGFCPPGYSAHERMYLGWLTPVELTAPTTVADMAALAEQPVAYVIRNDSHPDELFMLENRQSTGWDQSLPGSGLVIFHVDYDEEIWRTGVPNSSSRKRYSIVPANNQTSTSEQSGWAYPYADNDSLTDTSKPAATLLYANADGTRRLSKPVTHMALTADGLASFRFMGGTPTSVAIPVADGTARVLYRLGPVLIMRLPDGSIIKKISNE